MTLFKKEPALSAAALGLNLEILHNIVIEELYLIKEENERLRFELAALHSVVGPVTAFPQRTRKSELIPPEKARDVFFHQNIRILRAKQGSTHQQMAQLYGIPTDIWITYEGKRLPSADLLISISKGFNIPVDDLLHKNLSASETRPLLEPNGDFHFSRECTPSANQSRDEHSRNCSPAQHHTEVLESLRGQV